MIEALLILGASALGIGAVLYDPVVGAYREHQEGKRAASRAQDAALLASVDAYVDTLYEARAHPQLSLEARAELEVEIDRMELAQRQARAQVLFPG